MNSSTRVPDRQRSYKKGIDADATRRRREGTAIQIRKTIKEDRLNQRRRMVPLSTTDGFGTEDDEDFAPDGTSSSVPNITVDDLPRVAAMIQSMDVLEQTMAVSSLRKLLSAESNPPIQEVVALGVVPLLVGFLRRHDKTELQFESAWALTNIASGTTQHTEVVINSGAVPVFCELLLSTNDDVCEQAVWALGNISGDSPSCRDYVLNSGAMLPLLTVLRRSIGKISVLRNATWTLSNLCRGKPQPDFSLVSPALELLPHLIHSPDEEVVTDSLWALSYLSDGTSEKIQAVIEAGVVRKVVDLLGHSLVSVQTPALRTVGNIVTGNEMQTQHALDMGALERLLPLLKHTKKIVRKETCWTISNITAGTVAQIQHVIESNIIPPLIHQLVSAEFDVQKEAAWAISNATSGGNNEQIKYLVHQGCIPPLVTLLECSDANIINVCLDALLNILRMGDAEMEINGDNKMAIYIEEAEGVDKIQELQYHENEEIYDKALRIIKEYFGGDEEEDDLDLGPSLDHDAGQFTFGTSDLGGAAPQFQFQ
ncbi:hypothetical protein Poli38472_003202 [Pythium oligandrum]|uniref:Importin subunit alpha n=1 Tax=Pythium oligandrum TaxID=41045 RepID=A0A8K1C674_PYTOL|nr:hypothetical protein Poli38472_003202 [Pythium oligandrum]|eukprot:TMW57277.1 hypothetical protein Poli38472_003202 [Pythium oligandrum]